MKDVILVPENDEQLSEWMETLKRNYVSYGVFNNKDGKTVLSVNPKAARIYLNIPLESEPKKSFLPKWVKLILWIIGGYFALGMIATIYFLATDPHEVTKPKSEIKQESPNAEPVKPEPTKAVAGLILNAKEAIGASPAYFEKKWGKPDIVMASTSHDGCNDKPCEMYSYGGNTVYFIKGKAVTIGLDNTSERADASMITDLGFKEIEPDEIQDYAFGSKRYIWNDIEGLRVSINSVGYFIHKYWNE